jgi:hypothetical protein
MRIPAFTVWMRHRNDKESHSFPLFLKLALALKVNPKFVSAFWV